MTVTFTIDNNEEFNEIVLLEWFKLKICRTLLNVNELGLTLVMNKQKRLVMIKHEFK